MGYKKIIIATTTKKYTKFRILNKLMNAFNIANLLNFIII